MTRINCVPVACLTDKHLLAEYKEITRPFNKVIKRLEAGTMDQVHIPERYCLGKGHETFFFDKLKWLFIRYGYLHNELLARGFNINTAQFDKITSKFYFSLGTHACFGGWQPTPEDMYLNMARLAKRSNLKTVNEELNNETI